MNPLRWRMLFILALTMFATYTVAPTGVYFSQPKEIRGDKEQLKKHIPDWLPEKHINLGLDLQGGVQLVLGVDADSAIENKLARLGTELTRWANDAGKPVVSAYVVKGKGLLRVDLKEGSDVSTFKSEFKKEFPGLAQQDRDGVKIDFSYDEQETKDNKRSCHEAGRTSDS